MIGIGKSTIAIALEKALYKRNTLSYRLDGDNIRLGINKNLGFSAEDRAENIRRIAEVARLFNEAGIIVLSAFISPLAADRAQAQRLIGSENFIEIFIDCPLRVCEKRDVKGLYDKARKGLIPNFTGIDAPFENPKEPDLTVNTETDPPELSLKKLLDFIEPKLKLE